MSNGVTVDGEYIHDHRKTWTRVAPITRQMASAMLQAAGKFSPNSDPKADYLFVNKGWVVVSYHLAWRLAVYLHDGNYSLYVNNTAL